MSRNKTVHTILIICEGTNTEPNYFKGIKEDVISQNIWTEGIAIDIRPKPPLEIESAEEKETPHKSKRKKRKLRNDDEVLPISEIEEEYKAVPVRYVREAQQGLEDGTYDEVWAVFDKDYHPKHEDAFNLAQKDVNGKIVNIAFSSISFEYWVLLHFCRINQVFLKSSCKVNSKIINCGEGIHADDCYGVRCCSGFIKTNRYIPTYSKQSQIDLYALLKTHTKDAIINASWLRTYQSDTPIYDLNPYTDVDFLVKYLFRIEQQYHWMNINTSFSNDDIEIEVNLSEDNNLSITVTNQKNISLVFNKNLTIYEDGILKTELPISLGVLTPDSSKEFNQELVIDRAKDIEFSLHINDTDIIIIKVN